METIKSSSAKISENSSTTTSNNNHMGNGGLSSAFDRDSILRRTTENSSSLGGKRFEDIKKRYATKGGSSADDSCGDKENNTVKQPTTKKMNLFTSLFKESSSPSEIIASKRDLFFKNHHHHNANPQQHHHSTLPSQGTTTTTPLPINSNGNAFASPLPSSPSTLSNPSPPISSTTRHQNRSATMPVNTAGSSTTCGTAPPKGSSSYDYYGSDREKPLSSYLSSVSKIGSSSTSSAQHPGSRFTPSNYSSSNLSGGGPSKSQDSVTTTTTLPTSTKISNLINKVNSGTTHLNAISDDDEDEDCVDSTTTMTHRNNIAGFATELANKKKQLFPPSQQKCSTVGRIDSSSSPPPSVLSASVISGGAAIQPVTGPASNKISAFAANINNNNNNFHSGIYPSSIFATSNSPSPNNPTTQSHFAINGAQNQLISDQNNNGPPIAIVDKCIGFANLPNQFYRRAVKRGFEFTLMLVGESGLGKSTLINTLFLSDIYSDEHPGPSQRLKKTVEVETSKQILIENGVQMTLTVVDTPGFGDSVDNSACWQKILNHIENKYEEYLREESRINRKSFEDSRIHLCFYFIAPSGHGLKEIDIEFMKKLHEKVNILPLVAKADTMTPEEIHKFKRRILNEIRQNNINIYEFPCMDDPEENRRNQELKDKVPFAVMGSNTIFDINNRRVRGRKYAWGIAEVDNADHCDFSALRDMLIRRHMQHMKDVTANVLYENYRCYKLSGGHPDSISDTDNPLTQLIEEKKDYEDNLAKTEREMEHVFSAKVKEKKDKIRESEAELEKRYEQMKRNLEEQFRELEERRRNFEAEKHAWENGIPLVGHPQHLNGGGNQQQQQQQFLSHHHSHQGLNNVSNGNTHPISDMNRNDSNSYLNAQGGGAQHMSSYNNGVTSTNNIMSSNSTLNSVTSNKKGVPQYNDTAMKEEDDDMERDPDEINLYLNLPAQQVDTSDLSG